MRRLTQEQFIERSIISHVENYDYSKSVYTLKENTIIIICPIHGEFKQIASVHMKGAGCQKCCNERNSKKCRKTISQFIEDAKNVHGDFYDYSKFEYSGAHNKSIIICPLHGEFLQSSQVHLKGCRCPKCAKEQSDKWGWSKTKWLKIAKEGFPKLYIARIYNDNESFLKVGITTKLKSKYRLVQLPYNYEVLHEIENHGEIIWNLENKIKKELRKTHKYLPKIFFKGMYECYNLNSLNLIKSLCLKDLVSVDGTLGTTPLVLLNLMLLL